VVAQAVDVVAGEKERDQDTEVVHPSLAASQFAKMNVKITEGTRS